MINNKLIKPFEIFEFDDGTFSVFLDQRNYCYDWLSETKGDSLYGDGHCYDALFNDYLEKNYKNLNNKLQYDSENGMFCVYIDNIKDANKVASILSKLYNNEKEMTNLIKETKEKYDYRFNVRI